eukprot:5335921-Prymnesium_polylepis.2
MHNSHFTTKPPRTHHQRGRLLGRGTFVCGTVVGTCSTAAAYVWCDQPVGQMHMHTECTCIHATRTGRPGRAESVRASTRSVAVWVPERPRRAPAASVRLWCVNKLQFTPGAGRNLQLYTHFLALVHTTAKRHASTRQAVSNQYGVYRSGWGDKNNFEEERKKAADS